MTILEAKYQFGVKKFAVQVGDTLLKVCRRLYKADDDLHLRVLKTLNNRYDWFDMKPGTIDYLSEFAISRIREL